MKNLIIISGIILTSILIHSCKKEDDNSIRDADGNVYHSILIGNQEWLVENLKTTRYNNGDLIGTTIPATLDISADTMPKYQWAYDGMECAAETYGRLYTWYTATDTRGVCPIGWHVPTINEWVTLFDPYESPIGITIGAELMEEGTTHWIRSDIMGTNETGFTALPGGQRYWNNFGDLTQKARFWSSTEYNVNKFAMFYPLPIPGGWGSTPSLRIEMKGFGFSIRCIKDSI